MIMIDRQKMHEALRATKEPEVDPQTHDRVVKLALRWAARRHADVTDVDVVCDALGLDLSAALRRSQGS